MGEFPVTAIRSVDLGVPDIARAEAFYAETWGLAVVARESDAVYLRATGRDHHVLALHPHRCAEILSVSFRVSAEKMLERIVSAVTCGRWRGHRTCRAQTMSLMEGSF